MTPETVQQKPKSLIPEALSVAPEAALMTLILEHRATCAAQERTRLLCEATKIKVDALSAELDAERAHVHRLAAELHAVRINVFWRVSAPLRHASTRFPWIGAKFRAAARGIRQGLQNWRFAAGASVEQAGTTSTPVIAEASNMDNRPAAVTAKDRLRTQAIAIPLTWSRPISPGRKIAVLIHLRHVDLTNEIYRYLIGIDGAVDIYVSTDTEFHAALIRSALEDWKGGRVVVRTAIVGNKNPALRFSIFADALPNHSHLLCLDEQDSDDFVKQALWRQFMMESVVGSGDSAESILCLMDEKPEIAIVGVQDFGVVAHQVGQDLEFSHRQAIAAEIGLSLNARAQRDFPSGAIFWARPAALATLMSTDLALEKFDEENTRGFAGTSVTQQLIYLACEDAGYRWVKVARPEFYIREPDIEHVNSPAALHAWLSADSVLSAFDGENSSNTVDVKSVSRAAAGLVKTIQQRGLYFDLYGPRSRPEMRLAIGLWNQEDSIAQIERAIDACVVSLEGARLSMPSAIYVLANSDFSPDERRRPTPVQVLSSAVKLGFAQAHNRMMAMAFKAGATNYLALNSHGLLHPDAIGSLIDMMAANRGRALIDAVHFPLADTKTYGLYDFETPWVSEQCLMVSRVAYDCIGKFDQDLSLGCEHVDYSWRARAAGLSVKTCPRALFLHSDSGLKSGADFRQTAFESNLRLLKKWAAPASMQTWLQGQRAAALSQSTAGRCPYGAEIEVVPVEWQQYADFDRYRSSVTFRQSFDD